MISPFRIALVVLGLAAVVYGTASLTGGWLGTAPWLRPIQPGEWLASAHPDSGFWVGRGHVSPHADDAAWFITPGPGGVMDFKVVEVAEIQAAHLAGREWISGGVVAAGTALVAFGAWPRRRRTEARS